MHGNISNLIMPFVLPRYSCWTIGYSRGSCRGRRIQSKEASIISCLPTDLATSCFLFYLDIVAGQLGTPEVLAGIVVSRANELVSSVACQHILQYPFYLDIVAGQIGTPEVPAGVVVSRVKLACQHIL